MPAERTSDRCDDASPWLLTSNSDIAFAPNVTPGTFNEFYAPTNDAATLSPGLEGSTALRRTGHGRKKPINHIPRPPNAFILFRSSFVKNQHVSSEVETNHSTLSKIIGLTWKNLSNEERQIWHARARLALDEHRRRFPSYAFKPVHNKPRGGGVPGVKRKVREVEPKDHTRCVKIAELLVGGKTGLDLEVAIQEFDKNRVPEIVTRFEAPITANNYALNNAERRRSSRQSQAPPSPPSLDIPREPCEDSPSFNQHSLSSPTSLSSSPSFDFNTYSLTDNGPPLTPFETPTPTISPLQFSYNTHDSLVHPRPSSLSIPSNFSLIDDSWAQSGSPTSNPTDSLPTTPCQLTVPFPESYTTAYEQQQQHRSDYHTTPPDTNPYANHHSLYSAYHGFGGNEYSNVQSGLLSCATVLDHCKVPGGDMDFIDFYGLASPMKL